MSAGTLSNRPAPIHAVFLLACRATWLAGPVVVAISVAWALAATPILVAGVGALPVPWVLLTLPFLLVTTGAFRGCAAIAGGRPVEWRRLAMVDPVLALLAWCLVLSVAALPAAGDGGVVAASVAGAVGALVLPLAFAYGAVRDRRGLAAVRGGLLVAVLRPALALSVTAMIVLAAFMVVASAGALVLCAPALVAIFACTATASDLRRHGIVLP